MVDRVQVTLFPVIIGRTGLEPIFQGGAADFDLELIESLTLDGHIQELIQSGLPPGLRFRDLRHSYATWLVSDGVPINVVSRLMGHEQISTTLDRYTRRSRLR